MLSRENSICFISSWLDACAKWRFWLPHLNLPGSSFFIFAGQPDWKQITGHDYVGVQRMCTEPQFEFMKVCRSVGQKVFMDLDDLVFHLPSFNPSQQIFHQHAEGFRRCLRAADVISVSTPFLADALKKEVQPLKNVFTQKEIPVIVVANKMDERILAPVQPRREELVVGWAGSNSHSGDLQIAMPALRALKAERPDVVIQIRGCEPPPEIGDMVEWRQWMPVPEFSSRMPTWGWSLALAPLVQHNFNSAKSCIKAIESAYCGIPTLCSWVPPYEEFCSHDAELGWLLCSNPLAWKRKLRELVHDEGLRQELGQRCLRVAQEHYSWNRPHTGWQQLLDALKAV